MLITFRQQRTSGSAGSAERQFTGDMAIDDIYVGDWPGPSSVAVGNVTGSSAIGVMDQCGMRTTVVEYGPVAGFGQGVQGMVLAPANSPATITGLTGSTTYDFYITDSCSATRA